MLGTKSRSSVAAANTLNLSGFLDVLKSPLPQKGILRNMLCSWKIWKTPFYLHMNPDTYDKEVFQVHMISISEKRCYFRWKDLSMCFIHAVINTNRPKPAIPAVAQPLRAGKAPSWPESYFLPCVSEPNLQLHLRDKWQIVLFFAYLFLFVYNFTGDSGRSRKSKEDYFWWKINSHWGDGWLSFISSKAWGN